MTTITCEFWDRGLAETPGISEFMNAICGETTVKDGDTVTFEVIEMPKTMARYIQSASSTRDIAKLYVSSLSEAGVGLYTVVEQEGRSIGDAIFFIPMSNIACIHPYGPFA